MNSADAITRSLDARARHELPASGDLLLISDWLDRMERRLLTPTGKPKSQKEPDKHPAAAGNRDHDAEVDSLATEQAFALGERDRQRIDALLRRKRLPIPQHLALGPCAAGRGAERQRG